MNLTALMVAYWYPPRGGGGVQRTVKFAKYLPSYNIQPIVLCASGSSDKLRDTTYETANKVIRVPYREPGRMVGRLFEYVRFERHAGWVRPAIRAALQTAHAQGLDVVYSTASPYINHIIARHVARELGLPWVADFRDLWTTNALYCARTALLARRQRAFESLCYRDATHILATSPSQRRCIIEDFGVAPSKVSIITNGFDAADFKTDAKPITLVPSNNNLVIGYFGSFYATYRPDDLVLALRLLALKKPAVLSNVQFLFVGDYDRGSLATLTQPALRDFVKVSNYVPHATLSNLRKKVQANLLYLPRAGTNIKAMIPQKVFEYLASRKPIFAVVPESDVRDLLCKHKAALIAPSGQPIAIAQQLEKFIAQVRAGIAPRAQGALTEYERYNLTGQLAEVLRGVAHA
ncbi:MAG: glycosyltransferase [Parcubacteria group bacterium]